jgi:hypothetical protein
MSSVVGSIAGNSPRSLARRLRSGVGGTGALQNLTSSAAGTLEGASIPSNAPRVIAIRASRRNMDPFSASGGFYFAGLV